MSFFKRIFDCFNWCFCCKSKKNDNNSDALANQGDEQSGNNDLLAKLRARGLIVDDDSSDEGNATFVSVAALNPFQSAETLYSVDISEV